MGETAKEQNRKYFGWLSAEQVLQSLGALAIAIPAIIAAKTMIERIDGRTATIEQRVGEQADKRRLKDKQWQEEVDRKLDEIAAKIKP